jgi:hypothetical protein
VDERELEHAEVVFGGLLEACEDASALLQPANESFDDVPLAVCVPVEGNRPGVAIFVTLGRNDWRDSRGQQVLVDPVGAEAFVTRQSDRAQRFPDFLSGDCRSLQQRFQGLRFVRLSRREVDVEGMAVAIAKQMDLGRKPAPRAA